MRTLLALFCSAVVLVAVDRPAFFAMDTAARLEPKECAQVLVDLGYAGLGGRPATAKAHASALKAKELFFFNGYHVTNFFLPTVKRSYRLTSSRPSTISPVPGVLFGWVSIMWLFRPM